MRLTARILCRAATRRRAPFGAVSASAHRTFAGAAASDSPLKKTGLYDAHVARGGKMVPFAGYQMPVGYKDKLEDAHNHVRQQAGLFDVSHMGQVLVRGADRDAFVEAICGADMKALPMNTGTLSLLTNDEGGIRDDCIVTKKADHVHIVVNGACKDADFAHMNDVLSSMGGGAKDVSLELMADRELLALQGPQASAVLGRLVDSGTDLSSLGFMQATVAKLAGRDVWIQRSGYTGEDGFEVSMARSDVEHVFDTLLDPALGVWPIGLGARDTLRLEAGMCLYGHDLDTTTTPVEAVLMWTISKRRRAEGGFPGHAAIMKQFTDKSATRKRIGLNVLGGPPAREGAEILDEEGNLIGAITSGTVSPTTKLKIAMGYVPPAQAAVGTRLQVRVRNRVNEVVVAKMPWIETHYYKP